MVNPKIDELSMMTYLSQFPNAKLKPGAPLRPRTNPARVRAYGPGMPLCHPSYGVKLTPECQQELGNRPLIMEWD